MDALNSGYRCWVAILVTSMSCACSVASGPPVPTREAAAPTMTLSEPMDVVTLPPDSSLSPEVFAAAERLSVDDGWPDRAVFEAKAAEGAQSTRIVECLNATISELDEVLHDAGPVVLREVEGHWALVVAWDETPYTSFWRATWDAADPDFRAFVSDEGKLACDGANLSTIRPSRELLSAAVYASVVSVPKEPLYVEPIEVLERGTRSRLEDVPTANQDYWDEQYEYYRRHRVRPRCGNDSQAGWKLNFMHICGEVNRPGCQLELAVGLLHWGDGSPLLELPPALDVRLFMLGLLVDYPGTEGRTSLAPANFAWALWKDPLWPLFDLSLVQWLADPETDPWNRIRFAEALYHVRSIYDETNSYRQHAEKIASLPGVTPMVARVLQAMASLDERNEAR